MITNLTKNGAVIVLACMALGTGSSVRAADEIELVDPRDARAMGYEAVDHGWREPSILQHARQNHTLEFDRALRAGQKIDDRDLDGNTPLHWAVFNHHPGMIRLILARKGQVNAANDKGETPLHWAARHCRLSVIELLLDAGADTGALDRQGRTPWQQAERLERAHVVERLRHSKGG